MPALLPDELFPVYPVLDTPILQPPRAQVRVEYIPPWAPNVPTFMDHALWWYTENLQSLSLILCHSELEGKLIRNQSRESRRIAIIPSPPKSGQQSHC